MARFIKIVFVFLWVFTAIQATSQPLSPDAKVSIITVSPGKELYSSFGHSALWISDPAQGIDKVYNYGTFDFRTEGFYIKFLRGTLPYQLSVSPMYYTIYGAQAENRAVREQVIDLLLPQKQRLYDFLETNYLPQNREYAYKFFFDNCSTRLRDALLTATNDSIRFVKEPINGTFEAHSFRDWMNMYLGDKPWAKFGMNLAIGLPSDAIATSGQEMYLPNNLEKHLNRAKLGEKLLVAEQKVLLQTMPIMPAPFNFITYLLSPQFIFLLVFVLVSQFTLYQFRKNIKSFVFDRIFFGIVGLVGWILLLLWVATDHGVTAWNLNLLWAVPFHLPIMLYVGSQKQPSWLKAYIGVCFWLIVALIIICISGFVWRNSALIPIESGFLVLAVGLRLSFLRKKIS